MVNGGAFFITTCILSCLAWVFVLTPIYFIGAYGAGIFIGVYYDKSIEIAEKLKYVFIVLAVLTTAVCFWCYQNGFEKVYFISVRESLLYIQKLSVAALVLVAFKRAESRLPSWLGLFATYAFPIYFIHAFFEVILFANLFKASDGPYSFWLLLTYGVVGGTIVLLLSLAISMLIRKLFGRYSRLLVGT